MKKILLCLLMVGAIFGLTGYGNDKVEEQQPQEEVQIQEYGYVERETAEVLVAKFNTQVVDNGSLNPASEEYMTTHEDAYWYGLITGIYLIVYPEEFTGDLSSDIVDYMVLYVEKNTEFMDYTDEYLEHLIIANNPDITSTEASELVSGAIDSASAGTTINNGKGIDIGYVEDGETYQYQVIRLYE